jgi:hypothetical protein
VSPNDENTHATANAVSDQVATLFSHFLGNPHASWENFPQAASELYLERLKLGLTQLAMCVQSELHRRILVEPIELGV